MSGYVWDLSGTDARCISYRPGHLIHWIHFNHSSMREPGPAVDDDGLVHIEGEDLSLVVLTARIGLQHIPSHRRDLWAARLDAAEQSQASDFRNNGWVVEALQGAWSAITTTPVPHDDPAAGGFRVDHLRLGLDAEVRGGGDTDTVAAISGGLLGATHGVLAVPAEWRRVLHGWPGMRSHDLIELASTIVRKADA